LKNPRRANAVTGEGLAYSARHVKRCPGAGVLRTRADDGLAKGYSPCRHEFLLAALPFDLPQNKAARQQWIQDNETCHKLWDGIRVAWGEQYPVHMRRMAMKEFRDHPWVGVKNYNDGKYPPNVPIWYFQEIK
jgi:hypothetical protein